MGGSQVSVPPACLMEFGADTTGSFRGALGAELIIGQSPLRILVGAKNLTFRYRLSNA